MEGRQSLPMKHTLYEDMEFSLTDGLELFGEKSAAGYMSSFFFLLGDRHIWDAREWVGD